MRNVSVCSASAWPSNMYSSDAVGRPLGIHAFAFVSSDAQPSAPAPRQNIAVARHVCMWSTGSRHGRIHWQRPRLSQQSS